MAAPSDNPLCAIGPSFAAQIFACLGQRKSRDSGENSQQAYLDVVQYFRYYGNMEFELAIKRLSALAQPARLEVFRLLVKVGPEGLAAGEIARKLDVPANTMSAQLLILSNAGLIRARREGRSIIYAINFEAMRDLLVFLTKDCCGGRAEICAPLASFACCEPKSGEKHEALTRTRRR